MDIDRRLHVIEVLLSDLLRAHYFLINQGQQIMIDTSQALASVQRLTTESASLRQLLATVSQQLTKVSQDLATANANNDPAAQARVQNDLNQIAQLADTEDAQVAAAIQANTQGGGQQQGGATTQAPPADQSQPSSPAQPINQTQNPS